MTRSFDRAEALPETVDLAVIGAGPAGLAAATLAADRGLDTLVFDEMDTLGGRIHRNVLGRTAAVARIVGRDGDDGRRLAEAFRAGPAGHARRATVWSLVRGDHPTHPFEIAVSIGGRTRLVAARAAIVAAGARERPMPFPGWTLPGVITAGAAQMALKASALVPDGRIVLAGSGPLLLLVADQLRVAGAEVVGVLDTTPLGNRIAALPHLVDFLRSEHLADGLRLALRMALGNRRIVDVRALRVTAEGDRLRIGHTGAFGRGEIVADHLLVHQGVVPDTGLVEAAGAEMVWDPADRAPRPRVDDFGRTSVPGLAVAGDGAGIAGATAAPFSGRLAALGVLTDLGRLDAAAAEAAARDPRRARARALRGRAFLDRLFRPAAAFLAPPDDDTVVCRCEERTAGEVRAAIALGVPGPNQLKVFTRCGMGPCQGRMCGATLTEMIAAARAVDPAGVGSLRPRPPIRPVSLAELATLPPTAAARAAVGIVDPDGPEEPRP